ncbi:MAG: hypothetical protein ACXWEK_03335 [Solirubrobacterales bacterium]
MTLDEPEKGTVVIKGTDTAEALLDETKGFIKETPSLRDTGAQKLVAQWVHGDKKGPRLGALLALDTASASHSARLPRWRQRVRGVRHGLYRGDS